jgi:hypothetical protein
MRLRALTVTALVASGAILTVGASLWERCD